MIPFAIVAGVSLLYFGLLFAVAFYADKKRRAGKSLTSNAYIYSLSITIFLSSLTFYGSVGRAATNGLDFLALFLGPTLMAFTWCFLLRKIVHICKEQHIVSLADFISSRYGKSASLGAVVTIFLIVSTLPYIAIQLKAIAQTFNLLSIPPVVSPQHLIDLFHTFDLLSIPQGHLPRTVIEVTPTLPSYIDTPLIVALLLGIFCVLFGARQLDASERHDGLITVVALQSLVKLFAFLGIGLFVTFGLFNGFGDIFNQFLHQFPTRSDLFSLGTETVPYSLWFSSIFISMTAIICLPSQFHVMVIENCSESHIRTAMWFFPLYTFVFSIFIIPIALCGLMLYSGNVALGDYFVLKIPMDQGAPWLALAVFLGGLSASAGLVMVSSVTLSTMILNHLVMPVVLRFKKVASLSGFLINTRRTGIFAVILGGYFYYHFIGESFSLVSIGLISFVATCQLVPPLLGGLYWEKASRNGAMAGLVLGFSIWAYTLLVPSLISSGWLKSQILVNGPWGLHFLKPQNLFGLQGLDSYSHALFWSLFFNVGGFILFSLASKLDQREKDQGRKFILNSEAVAVDDQRKILSKAPTIVEFVELMTKFIGEERANAAISDFLKDRMIDHRGSLSEHEIPTLKRFTEKTLAGSVGAAPARIIIENYLATRGSKMEDVFDIFGNVTLSRTESREQLSVLYEAARVVASGRNLQKIFDDILNLLIQQFMLDSCIIRIFDAQKDALTVHSQLGMSMEHLLTSERDLSHRTYVTEAFQDNTVIVINDTDIIHNPNSVKIVKQEGIKSFAHTPIVIEGKPIGVLSAFSRSIKGIFTEEFMEFFKSLAGQVGVAWRNAKQTEKLIEARRREKELEIAKTIQLGLLPSQVPHIPGLSLAGTCETARLVGGDYYDFLFKQGEYLDILIADVSGHNVGAALLMAQARTFIHALANKNLRPTEIMCSLNEFFYQDLTKAELFITMFYIHYHVETRRFSYASAGHNPPFLYRGKNNGCDRLDAEGLILGVRKEVDFEEKEDVLGPDDMLLLYTDGIIEAQNNQDDFFGDHRLNEFLVSSHQSEPTEIIRNLLEEVKQFTGKENFEDDVSLVVLKPS